MQNVKLRKVGGSVMLAVPADLLAQLDLRAGASVAIGLDSGRLIVTPAPERRYSLQELIARCDASAPRSDEDKSWLAEGAVGSELI